jgi:hypothetical protein
MAKQDAIGSRINCGNLRNRIFKVAATVIGRPELQPHDLRRIAATLMVAVETPHKMIWAQLGRPDIRTTLYPCAQAPEEAHEASVLRMEEVLDPAREVMDVRRSSMSVYDSLATQAPQETQ